jgi:hypothetical protein
MPAATVSVTVSRDLQENDELERHPVMVFEENLEQLRVVALPSSRPAFDAHLLRVGRYQGHFFLINATEYATSQVPLNPAWEAALARSELSRDTQH